MNKIPTIARWMPETISEAEEVAKLIDAAVDGAAERPHLWFNPDSGVTYATFNLFDHSQFAIAIRGTGRGTGRESVAAHLSSMSMMLAVDAHRLALIAGALGAAP